MSRDMALAAFAGAVQTAAERAGSLAELQDAIKTALRDLHAEHGETPAPAADSRELTALRRLADDVRVFVNRSGSPAMTNALDQFEASR